jgi:hypothetical protein
VPESIRVRHLLKRALRSYGLVCVRVNGLPESWDDRPDPATTHQFAQAATSGATSSPSSEGL